MPREGHDPRGVDVCPDHDISIHVPREGHDETVPEAEPFDFVFLSTCPVRGTTTALALGAGDRGISIHVPREGHDRCRSSDMFVTVSFLSTCPVRGTT